MTLGALLVGAALGGWTGYAARGPEVKQLASSLSKQERRTETARQLAADHAASLRLEMERTRDAEAAVELCRKALRQELEIVVELLEILRQDNVFYTFSTLGGLNPNTASARECINASGSGT